jgi:hypothetical protein
MCKTTHNQVFPLRANWIILRFKKQQNNFIS